MVYPDASSEPSQSSSRDRLSHNPDTVEPSFEPEQMISLVDSVLPFEACLYYQVMPLSIEASQLTLGMVNPEDTTAESYVKRQVAYIKYSVVTVPIPSEWHRNILSKYLSHRAKTQRQQQSQENGHSATGADQPAGEAPIHPSDQATFIVDSPQTLPTNQGSSWARPKNPKPPFARPSAVRPPISRQANRSSSRADSPSRSNARKQQDPLALNLPSSTLPTSLATMGKLPPKELTQALLSRVLKDGIGRLYFERHATSGRILWSKDGVVQAALDDLNLQLFQCVINELKQLTHLPLVPVQETRQVEIERTYHNERVVLRFRLMASNHGEEATLQVLRGAALKFYQQQQIDQLGRDALTFAHRLQGQVNQIRERARQTFTLEGTPVTTLHTISTLLKDIDAEINQLIQHNQEP